MGFHFEEELKKVSNELLRKLSAIAKSIFVIVISMFLIGGKWNG